MLDRGAAGPRSKPLVDKLATLLLVTVLVLFAAILGARSSGHAVLIDRSDSMQPAIAAGDLLITRAVHPTQVGRGDIITFTDPDHSSRTITHRVIERHRQPDGYSFLTRGDANTGVERWSIRADGTVGRLALVVPHAGRPLSTLGRPWIRFVLVTLAGLLLGGILIHRIWAG